MKISIFESEPWEKEYFERHIEKDNLSFISEPLSIENVKQASSSDIVIVFIHSSLDSKVIGKLKKARCIITRSVGFDHIDLKACKRKKISVFNISDYGAQTVAEHTFALILALTRKITSANTKSKLHNFDLEGLEGKDIYGKTLGVIGPGKIGQEVIKRAKAFGLEVIAYCNKPDEKISKELGFKYVSLTELLRKSDIITLHAPLTKQTYHVLNSESLAEVKKGVYIINTARGALIDSRALLGALDSGIVGGAALDVLEGEDEIREEHELLSKGRINKSAALSLIINNEILRHPNVIATPHIAFYTSEALERIVRETCMIVKRFKKKDKNGALV